MISITITDDIKDVANKIALVLDTDSGGANTFTYSDTVVLPGEVLTAGVRHAITSPQALFEFTTQEYDLRFADQVKPTMEECTIFLTNLTIEVLDD